MLSPFPGILLKALLKFEDIVSESSSTDGSAPAAEGSSPLDTPSKRLGWFMFGSQVLGFKSWGVVPVAKQQRGADSKILERLELAVGFFPYMEETEEGSY